MRSTIRNVYGRSCIIAAVLVAIAAVAVPAWSQTNTDITNAALPHTADSRYSWGGYYSPEHVSDNVFGLYGSWHSCDERCGLFFPHWVQIDFGTLRTVTQLNILAYSEAYDALNRLKDFRFEGSNDGVIYTPLHEGLLQYANRHEWQSFFFQNTAGYRYYRLYGLSNWGCYEGLCGQMIIEEWEMFEGAPVSVEETSWGRLKSMLR